MFRAPLLLAGMIALIALPSPPQTAKQKDTKTRSKAKKQTPSGPGQPLTLSQIEQLISIPTPDDIVAQEIRARGVRDPVTRESVSLLKSHGAGGATLAVLSNLIPHSSLTVLTTAGAQIVLDGGPALTVGTDGNISFGSLDPGGHSLEIRKTNFRPRVESVNLLPNQLTSLSLPLEWAVGFLTVNTDPLDAQVRVAGKPQSGRVVRMTVPTGQITVSATAPLKVAASQTVLVEPGKEVSVSLSLPWDQAALNQMANQIHAAFKMRQYQIVLQQAERYLQTGSRENEVLAEIAVSDFELDRLREFSAAAQTALAAGAALRFPVQHHHLGIRVSLHPATLQLTNNSLTYEPEGPCNIERLEVPLRSVRMGRRETVALGNNGIAFSVNLNVPNPTNPKKEMELNLVTTSGTDLNRTKALRELLQNLTR